MASNKLSHEGHELGIQTVGSTTYLIDGQPVSSEIDPFRLDPVTGEWKVK